MLLKCPVCGRWMVADFYNNQSFGDLLKLETEHAKVAIEVAIQNIRLLDSKQKDYGPDNISDFGVVGVIIRLNDKLSRLKHMFFDVNGKPRTEVNVSNESIEDTFRDISNYGTIGYMVQTNQWPSSSGMEGK